MKQIEPMPILKDWRKLRKFKPWGRYYETAKRFDEEVKKMVGIIPNTDEKENMNLIVPTQD